MNVINLSLPFFMHIYLSFPPDRNWHRVFFYRAGCREVCDEVAPLLLQINNDENWSPWMMSLKIFTSAKLFTPAFNSSFQFFIASLMKFISLSDILHIFKQSIILLCGTTSLDFLLPIHVIATFFGSLCSSWESADQCRLDHQFLLFPCGIISYLGNSLQLASE